MGRLDNSVLPKAVADPEVGTLRIFQGWRSGMVVFFVGLFRAIIHVRACTRFSSKCEFSELEDFSILSPLDKMSLSMRKGTTWHYITFFLEIHDESHGVLYRS